MKILLSFCGTGYGHYTRSVSIAKELEKRGYEIVLATQDPIYQKIKNNSDVKDFELFKIPTESIIIEENGKFNKKKTIIKSIFHLKNYPIFVLEIKKLLNKINPDILISDTVFISAQEAYKISIPNFFISNQTRVYDFFSSTKYDALISQKIKKEVSKRIKEAEKFIVPDFRPPNTICGENIDYFDMEEKFMFSGPIIRRNPEDVDEINFNKKTFLVLTGGTEKSDKKFEDVAKDMDIQIVVLGSKHENKTGNVIYKKFVPDVFPYMKGSFAGISHGGHSNIMEYLVYGKPMIAMSTKGMVEREKNINGLEKRGLGIKIDNLDEMENAIEKLLNDSSYTRNAKKMSKLYEKENGVKNIIKTIERCC